MCKGKLDKTCFGHDDLYANSKNLTDRTVLH